MAAPPKLKKKEVKKSDSKIPKRENVTEKPVQEKSDDANSEDLLESFEFDFDSSVTSFDTANTDSKK